jgi:hypothetical protein
MVRAKDRMKNFIEISRTMTTIADLLSAVRSDQMLSESELLGEIAFQVSGNTGVKKWERLDFISE